MATINGVGVLSDSRLLSIRWWLQTEAEVRPIHIASRKMQVKTKPFCCSLVCMTPGILQVDAGHSFQHGYPANMKDLQLHCRVCMFDIWWHGAHCLFFRAGRLSTENETECRWFHFAVRLGVRSVIYRHHITVTVLLMPRKVVMEWWIDRGTEVFGLSMDL